jgi:hypothetical protein
MWLRKTSGRELDDAASAEAYLVDRRGPLVSMLIMSWARWINAFGPEALEQAYAPRNVRTRVNLDPAQRAKALKAARAMLAVPGHVWDELGSSFTFMTVSPALAALVSELEQEPARGRGRPEGPGRFARRMLAYGAGELALLELPQLSTMELVAVAVASGLAPGTKGNEQMRETLLDAWRHHRERNLPKNPAAALEEARARIGPERLRAMRDALRDGAEAVSGQKSRQR